MALAVVDRLVAAFTAANAATSDAQQRVTVYNGSVPGQPTTRYVVVFAGPPVFTRGSFGAAAADATGIVTVQFAASKPDTMASPVNEANWVADVGVKALLDNTFDVDGYSPGIYLEHFTSEPPLDVNTVPDRVVSMVVAQFTYSANRI